MPRAHYMNFREQMDANNAMIHTFANDHNMPRDWFTYQPLESHPIVTSAVRKAAILAPYVDKFLQDFRDCSPDYRYGEMKMLYPVIWNADRTAVIVFPNLPVDDYRVHRYSHSSLSRETPWFPTQLASLKSTILHDLGHEHKRKAWLPTSRGIKRLGIRKEMSLTRAIARCFVTRDGLPLKDAQVIDNLAQRMLELNMPSEFHIAETVEDMRKMYVRESSETPHSCMDSRHNFRLPDDVRPIDLYGHCPNAKGAYIARGNTVLARTVCWYDVNDESWFYTRIYSTRSANAEELQKRCEEAGIRDGGNRNLVAHCDFEVPSSSYNGSHCIPIPYFDRRPFGSLACKYDRERNVYKVKLDNTRLKGWEYPHLESTQGSHVSNEERECNHCADSIDVENDDFVNVNGDIYCCYGCAYDEDAVLYVTGASEELMYDRDIPRDCVLTIDDNIVFSNPVAAIRRGNIYRHVPWADTEGDLFVHPSTDGMMQYGRGEIELDDMSLSPMLLWISHRIDGNIPTNNRFNPTEEPQHRIKPLTITASAVKMRDFELRQDGRFFMPFACESTQSNFSDAHFNAQLEGLLERPANYLIGVNTLHPTR